MVAKKREHLASVWESIRLNALGDITNYPDAQTGVRARVANLLRDAAAAVDPDPRGEHGQIDWVGVHQHLEWLWENPEEFATNGSSEPWTEGRDLLLLELGVLFGIDYEHAYPTGRRDEWPVSIEERPSENGGRDD